MWGTFQAVGWLDWMIGQRSFSHNEAHVMNRVVVALSHWRRRALAPEAPLNLNYTSQLATPPTTTTTDNSTIKTV